MRKFSVIAVYVVHYGQDYLEYSIRSIYDHVDKIIISVGLKSWSYKGSKPIDENFLKWILDLPKKYEKIQIITGEWSKDEDQRNDTIQYVKDFDYYFLLDYDEIYDPVNLDGFYDFAEDHKEFSVFRIPFLNFWRSFGYVIQEEVFSPVQRFFRIGRRFKFKLSCISSYKRRVQVDVPSDICCCYHFSYAKTVEEISYKINTWMHAPDISANWLERFVDWNGNRTMKNLYPLRGQEQIWKKAMEFDKNRLPFLLQSHPYYSLDVIF